MKNFVAVDIPTRPYIKAYVMFKLGPYPKMEENASESIGSKLYDLLKHSTNERASQYKKSTYKTTFRIYIPQMVFIKKGNNLNQTNIRGFNRFIEMEAKERFCQIMDDLTEVFPSFKNNLPEVRRKMGISNKYWPDASLRKIYYRRNKKIDALKAKNKLLLQTKNT